MNIALRKLALGAAALVLVLGLGPTARADLASSGFQVTPPTLAGPVSGDPQFTYSFTSNSPLFDATGTLVTTDLGNIGPGGSDEQLATSGHISVIGGGYSGNTFQLIPNPVPPSEQYSPTGYFIYDNLVYPGTNPSVDNGGLLFGVPGSVEINVFSNGVSPGVPNGTSQIYDNTGANLYGAFSLTQVPEPAFFQGGVLLALAGGGVLRRCIRNRR